MNRDHPDYSIVKISQNTEKSPGDLKFLSLGLYNDLTSTLLSASVTISHSIQPLDSQGHILIFLDRMYLLFTWVHFLFWQLGRVGGQYTTKARIDKTQQNMRCRLCGDRDETINHIINESRKLAQRNYKTRHDWMNEVVHWELWKKLEFNHTDKWYMLNPESVLKMRRPKFFGIFRY